MRRLALIFLAALALIPAASPATPDRLGFRLADGSVRCELVAPSRVVCTSRGAGSLTIAATGVPVSVRRAAATTARVLRQGSRWARGGISCAALRSEVRCTNRSGALLAVGGESVAVLAPAAAAVSR